MPHIRPLAQSSRCVLSDSEGTDLFSPPMGLVGGGPYGNALKDEIGEQAVFFFFFLLWSGFLLLTYVPRLSQCLERHRPE